MHSKSTNSYDRIRLTLEVIFYLGQFSAADTTTELATLLTSPVSSKLTRQNMVFCLEVVDHGGRTNTRCARFNEITFKSADCGRDHDPTTTRIHVCRARDAGDGKLYPPPMYLVLMITFNPTL